MATELSSFAELKKSPVAPAAQTTAAIREKETDAQGRAYATGRRKNAVARVWVKLGTGKITVNGRDQKIYFARATQGGLELRERLGDAVAHRTRLA